MKATIEADTKDAMDTCVSYFLDMCIDGCFQGDELACPGGNDCSEFAFGSPLDGSCSSGSVALFEIDGDRFFVCTGGSP